MPDGWIVVIYIVAIAAGLLIGRGLWALYVSFRVHRPDCPYRDEVLAEAMRVKLDIDDLVMGRKAQPHG
jgi:hypothetical protein